MRKLLSFCTYLCLALPCLTHAQSGLIVNEVSQGTCCARDWVELIVVSDSCETVDLRHWVIDDNNGDFVECPGPDNGALKNVGLTNGHIRFTDDDIWAAVPAGTMILLYSFDPNNPDLQAEIDDLADDYFDDDCDFLRVIPINSTTQFFEKDMAVPSEPSTSDCPQVLTCPNGGDGNPSYSGAVYGPLDDNTFDAALGQIGFSISADACQVRRPDYTYFHGISWGQGIMDCIEGPDLDGGPDALHVTDIGVVNRTYYLRNFTSDDYRDVTNWAVSSASSRQSPGRANSCENAQFIASLRRPVHDATLLDHPVCDNPTIDTTFCLGDTIDLLADFHSGEACYSDEFTWRINDINDLISIVDITDSTAVIATLDVGSTTLEVELTLSNEGLYLEGDCDGDFFPTVLNVNYNVEIIDPALIELDTNRISTCAGTDGMAEFDLGLYTDVLKQGADTIEFYSDVDQTMPIGPVINTMGETIFAVVYQYSCQSPALELILDVEPMPSDTIRRSICPLESFEVGGVTFDMANPIGDVVVQDMSGIGCDTMFHVIASFDAQRIGRIDDLLCPTDTIRVEDEIYHIGRPSGIDTLMMSSVLGCDSVVIIDLRFRANDTTKIDPVLCPDEFRIINARRYDILNPRGLEIIEAARRDGCDSIIEVDLTFLSAPVSMVNPTICSNDTFRVDGRAFTIDNPAGRDTIPNGASNGCDSIVEVSLNFISVARDTIDDFICRGDRRVIGGIVFDESRLQEEILLDNQAANGCDSVILVDLQLIEPQVFMVRQDLCDGDTLTINGTDYTSNNLSNLDTLFGQASNGCDSIIDVDLNLLSRANLLIDDTLCAGDHIMINGIRYDESNRAGVETLDGQAANGCDSIVDVDLSFYPEARLVIREDLCNNDTLTINGVDYHADNPSNIDTIPGGSSTGCDSILDIAFNIISTSSSLVDDELCLGDTLRVNGTPYHGNMLQGMELINNGAANGCDSMIMVDLQLLLPQEHIIDDMICPDDTIIVNGVSYHQGNTMGTEILEDAANNGCDSIITIQLTNLDYGTLLINDTVPLLDSFVVEGQTFDRFDPDGVIVLENEAANGCDSIITVDYQFIPLDILAEAFSPLCVDELGQVLIDEISTDAYPVNLSVEPGGQSFTLMSPSELPFGFEDLLANDYRLTIVDAQGFQGLFDFSIDSSPEITFFTETEHTAYFGESLELTIQTSANIDSISWTPADNLSCSDCLSTTLDPRENVTFLVKALDVNGCEYELDIDVKVQVDRKIYVANVFSPNDDGINDVFLPQTSSRISTLISFKIFDRWGKLVHLEEGGDISQMQGWTGREGSILHTPGVYSYIAQVRVANGDIEQVAGDVTLVR